MKLLLLVCLSALLVCTNGQFSPCAGADTNCTSSRSTTTLNGLKYCCPSGGSASTNVTANQAYCTISQTCAAATATDSCNVNTDCTSCSAAGASCGWCRTAGMCTASANCASSWYSQPTASTCSAVYYPCSGYTNCKDCGYYSGCGWCPSTGVCVSGNANGPTSGSCPTSISGSKWIPGTSSGTYRSSCPASCTDYSSCSTCIGNSRCSWCGYSSSSSLSGNCFDTTLDPLATNCPYYNSFYYFLYANSCAAGTGINTYSGPSSQSGDGGDSSAFTTFNPVAGDGSYPSKAKAAFPLFFIILALTITGWSIACCGGALRPTLGSRVGAAPSFVSNQNMEMFALIGMGCIWVLLLASAAADMWSQVTVNTGFFTVTAYFGVTGQRVTYAGTIYRAYFTCAPPVGATSFNSDQIKTCVSYILGSVFTLVYESMALLFSSLAILYAIQTKRSGMLSARIWHMSFASFVSSLAATLDWALTSHIILEGLFENSTSVSTGTTKPTLGASWGLMFASTLLQTVILMFWRSKIQYTAVGATIQAAVVVTNSPVMFSGGPAIVTTGPAMVPVATYPAPTQVYAVQSYPPPQQYAQPAGVAYPPQQPVAYAQPTAPPAGYVQQQPVVNAGFAQMQ